MRNTICWSRRRWRWRRSRSAGTRRKGTGTTGPRGRRLPIRSISRASRRRACPAAWSAAIGRSGCRSSARCTRTMSCCAQRTPTRKPSRVPGTRNPEEDSPMMDLFRKELELCNVRPGETVAGLSAGDGLRHYARDFIAAGQQLGAKMLDVHLPGKSEGLKAIGKNDLARHPDAMRKLRSASMIVDLLVVSFSHEGDELQNAGARIL